MKAFELCLEGKAPPESLQHLAGCAHCKAELDLFRSFHEMPRDEAEASAVERIADRLHSPRAIHAVAPRRRWAHARWFGAASLTAAATLLIAALGIELRRHSAPAIATPAGIEDVTRSGVVSLLSPRGDIAEAPSRIQWQPVEGARRYEVSLLEVDQVAFWTASTSGAQIDIPAEAAARIVPAKTLLVRVKAFDSAGRLLAQSHLERFRVLQNIYPH
jgi:hypothetical protein